MHFRKFMLGLVAMLLLINWTCDLGPVPDKKIILAVPFFNQECMGYCAPACIQMWAHLDNRPISQNEIAQFINAHPVWGCPPTSIEYGVGEFTCSEGAYVHKSEHEPGAQGDLIAMTITGIECGTPSIMPFHEDHAIIIRGHQWREDENGRPIAIRAYHHDPNNIPDTSISASLLKNFFQPSPSDYWIVVAYPDYQFDGISGHNQFILLGGTYYGGPSIYDPKGLIDPMEN